MTPARWEWDDDWPLIADEDTTEDEGGEGSEERVVGVVAGEVVIVEGRDDDEVEGSADAEVGVAIVEGVGTDPELVGRVVEGVGTDPELVGRVVEGVGTGPELVGRVVGRSADDGAGEDEPPKTQTLSVPRGI